MAASSLTTTNPGFNFPGVVEGLIACAAAVACFDALGAGQRFPPGFARLIKAACGLLGLLAVRFGFSLFDHGRNGARLCHSLPAIAPKIECLMQLPFSEAAGARQLLFHATALAAFVGAAACARRPGLTWARTAAVFLALPFCWAAYQVAAYYTRLTHTFAGDNFVSPGAFYNLDRGTAVTSNPTWLWPLLMPAFAAALGLAQAGRGLPRAAGVVVGGTIAVAMLGSQQRGGYIVVGIFAVAAVIVAGVRCGERRGWGRRRLLQLGGGVGALTLLGAVFGHSLLEAVTSILHVPLRDAGLSLQETRFLMWQAAWRGIVERPFFGHGYQSWLSEFGKIAPRDGRELVFDTAHNLWVQMLFELGLVHTLAVAAFFAATIVWFARRRDVPEPARLGAIFLLLGTVVASSFQELDYVSSVYYQFAAFGGLTLGALDAPAAAAAPVSRKVRRRLLAAAACSLLGVAWIFAQFSWGGYIFDTIPAGPHPWYFQRWFRPWGALTAFATHKGAKWSVFPAGMGKGRVTDPSGATSDYRTFAFGESDFLVRNGSRAWGRQVRYEGRAQPGEQRLTSFWLEAPALQTDLAIFWSSELYPWDRTGKTGSHGERWCGKACEFVLAGDGCAAGRLVTAAPRPDVDAAHPLHAVLRAAVVSEAVIESARRCALDAACDPGPVLRPKDSTMINAEIPNPGGLSVPLPALGGADGWGWYVKIEAETAKAPSSTDIDRRTFGVLLQDLACAPAAGGEG